MPQLPYWRLSGYYFFYFAFIGAFSPYFGLYLQSLQLSAWEIALLMSQMQLMRLIGPYAWGELADRLGKRLPIVRLAALVSLLGFSSLFLTEHFAGLLLAMAVLAFFWSAALPLIESLTFDHLHKDPEGYSRIRLWGSVGFIVAVLGTGAVLDLWPVGVVLWASMLALAGIAGVALMLPEVAEKTTSVEASPPITHLLKQAPVRALLLACLLMSAAHGAFYIFFSIHLDAHGYSKTLTGLLWSLGVIAEIGVFLVMPRIVQRWPLRTILIACFVAAVGRFLLIGWAVDQLVWLIVAQLFHGLTFGAYHVAAIAAVNRWFVGKTKARGQALYSSLSFGAGGLLGGMFSGWTWEAWGAGATFTCSAAFAALGLVLVFRQPQFEPATGN